MLFVSQTRIIQNDFHFIKRINLRIT